MIRASALIIVLSLALCFSKPLNITLTMGARLKGCFFFFFFFFFFVSSFYLTFVCKGSSGAHVADGGKLSFLLHANYGGDSFPASYLTFHPLDGSEISFVSVLSVQDGKPRLGAPKPLGSAWSGCGPQGCSASQINGGVAESMLDTGIFFSTDPRTALVSGLKAPGLSGAPIASEWDLKQLVAFGSRAVGNTPLFQQPYWLLRFYAGTGSPVAGRDAYYTNDNSGKSENDLSKVGPWERIAYPGSRSVSDSYLLVEPFEGNGRIVSGQTISVETDAGRKVALEAPLPSSTNAIRFALGAVTKEQNSHFVVVEAVVTNVTLFEQSLRARKARGLPCAVANVVEGNNMTGAAEFNAWKNRKEFYSSCQSIEEVVNPMIAIENAKWTITALPVSARCPMDATGEVFLATQGVQPVVFEWSDGQISRANHRKNMLPGKYRVVATDAQGASNYEDIEVKSDVPAMKPIIRIRSVKNGRVAVRVLVNPRNVGPFECKWKKMKTKACNFTDEPFFGPDELQITNQEACTEKALLTKESVVHPLVAHVKVFELDAACKRTKSIFNLTVSARHGIPPYSYSWLHIKGHISSEPLMITDIFDGGLFSFNITDALGSVLVGKVMISPTLEVTWVKGLGKKKRKEKKRKEKKRNKETKKEGRKERKKRKIERNERKIDRKDFPFF